MLAAGEVEKKDETEQKENRVVFDEFKLGNDRVDEVVRKIADRNGRLGWGAEIRISFVESRGWMTRSHFRGGPEVIIEVSCLESKAEEVSGFLRTGE